jgi:prevent-host-death family protein
MGQVIGLGQLRSHTCGYLDRVVAGETIEIVRRGSLVARIVSARSDAGIARMSTRAVALDELRTRAGRCFDRVAAGETIEVVHRGRPVARIASLAGDPRGSA